MSLDFYWQDQRPSSSDRYGDRNSGYGSRSRTDDRYNQSLGGARWSGDVDTEVFVLVRGRQVFNTPVRGRSVSGQQVDITTPLPRRPVTVTLQDVQGRGQVELVEQPDQANNYTAKVRIVDSQPGFGNYHFTMAWDDVGQGYGNRGPNYSNDRGVLTPDGSYNNNGNSNGSARWTAQIDGRVRVSFRNNQAFTERLSGGDVRGEQVNFNSAMPRRPVDVEINKLRGRGDVTIIQRPSPENNYTLVIDIDDREGGSDVYDLQLNWR